MQEELAVLKPDLEKKVGESQVLMEQVTLLDEPPDSLDCISNIQGAQSLGVPRREGLPPECMHACMHARRAQVYLTKGYGSLVNSQVAKEKREVVEPKKEAVDKKVKIADAKVGLRGSLGGLVDLCPNRWGYKLHYVGPHHHHHHLPYLTPHPPYLISYHLPPPTYLVTHLPYLHAPN